MEFKVSRRGDVWNIRHINGDLLATAESLEMSSVRLVHTHLVGKIEAIWGATMHRRTTSIRGLARDLAVGHYFKIGDYDQGNGLPLLIFNGYLSDPRQGLPLAHAAYLSIHGDKARYLGGVCY